MAATAYLAALAGIRVFVTGGMGGVHRGAETSFDVSADLSELARTPIVVVCAGVKSILDVGLTLEVREISTHWRRSPGRKEGVWGACCSRDTICLVRFLGSGG